VLIAATLAAACGSSSPETGASSSLSPEETVSVSAGPPTSILSGSQTTTTTTRASTTTTTEVTPTTTTLAPRIFVDSEPAQTRSPSPLVGPKGYARFEPGPGLFGVASLVGLPADGTVTARSALAVKIDNSSSGQPQWNLADADLVFELNVEGATRFIAVYHSTIPDRIGPVRSARSSDFDILAAMNRPILASSGGNFGVNLAAHGQHDYGWLSDLTFQKNGCFYRSDSRPAPHNLVLDPVCAWDSATLAGPARPIVTHGDLPRFSGTPNTRFSVEMDGLTVTWVWDDDSAQYLRRQRNADHVDSDGEPVTAENVVVMIIRYVRSPFDVESPEAVTVGSGQSW
jgi:hypothetical protein